MRISTGGLTMLSVTSVKSQSDKDHSEMWGSEIVGNQPFNAKNEDWK